MAVDGERHTSRHTKRAPKLRAPQSGLGKWQRLLLLDGLENELSASDRWRQSLRRFEEGVAVARTGGEDAGRVPTAPPRPQTDTKWSALLASANPSRSRGVDSSLAHALDSLAARGLVTVTPPKSEGRRHRRSFKLTKAGLLVALEIRECGGYSRAATARRMSESAPHLSGHTGNLYRDAKRKRDEAEAAMRGDTRHPAAVVGASDAEAAASAREVARRRAIQAYARSVLPGIELALTEPPPAGKVAADLLVMVDIIGPDDLFDEEEARLIRDLVASLIEAIKNRARDQVDP